MFFFFFLDFFIEYGQIDNVTTKGLIWNVLEGSILVWVEEIYFCVLEVPLEKPVADMRGEVTGNR